MGVADHTKHFVGLDAAAPPVEVTNSVSRHIHVPERSFAQVVSEAGKFTADAELNLDRDVTRWAEYLFHRWNVSSGWLRGQTRRDGYADYTTETAPGGLVDDSGSSLLDGTTLVNSFVLPRLEATVAGYPVVVEYTNTRTPEFNLIELEAPTIYDGTSATEKRSDFIFLEVWLSLVAPSATATSTVTVVDSTSIADGDLITIGGIPLTARTAAPGTDEFLIVSGDEVATAVNIAAAINDSGSTFVGTVTAFAVSGVVTISAALPGVGGNGITVVLTLSVVGSIVTSGATSGGASFPNKPAENKLFRHGNVLSPTTVWLDDEIIDPTLTIETAQRVQVQYRIRSTGSTEQANHKTNPDGFSASASITAQGGLASPLAGFPFVPADKASILLGSDASKYGIEDPGLWVAGDGEELTAQTLSTLDGFVYAIPIGFVFRHSDVSDVGAATKGFDPVNNANGAPMHDHAGYVGVIATIAAGLSDRPDGEFADVPTQNSLLDMRRHVLMNGINLAGELQFQIQSLLDGSLRSWAIDTASKQTLGGTSGDVSTRFLVANEIGRLGADGGVPPTAGATDRGEEIRSFDHVARRFGDQSVVERVVFAFYPGDRPDGFAQGGPVAPGLANAGKYVVKEGAPTTTDTWHEQDVLHLDLTAFDASTLGGVFQGLSGAGSSAGALPDPSVAAFMPPGTVITDIVSMVHDDGHYDAAIDQSVQATTIVGLGTQHIEITLDANELLATDGLDIAPHRLTDTFASITPGSKRRIFVEVEITYPIGSGLTDTPDFEVVPDAAVYDGGTDGIGPGPVVEVDTAHRPADYDALLAPRFRQGFREVALEYVANDVVAHGAANPGVPGPVGGTNVETLVSQNRFDLFFPRRVYDFDAVGTAVVDIGTGGPLAVTVDKPASELGSSSRKVVLTGGTPLSGAGQTQVEIEYFPQDPLPNYEDGYQVAVYFRSNAPQTAGVKEGALDTTSDGSMPQTLVVEPLISSNNIWTGQVGMGSTDLPFPYVAPLDQIPINDGSIPSIEEWYFTATASTTIDDFNADVGLLALHAFVQVDSQSELTLGGAAPEEVPRTDAEFRAYYPFADDTVYRPTIMSQPMFGAVRHKVFVPMLVRATADVPNTAGAGGLLYRKDEVLLLVLTRFAALDEDNTVQFTDPAVDNRTSAAIYRTRNSLLLVGGRA